MSRDPIDVVRRGYDQVGDAYSAWSSGNPVRVDHVQRVVHRLPAGSRVVDLGCGAGDPATRLLAARHRVLGVDLSARQLARARLTAPSAAFVEADMTSFALRPGSVDAVVSLYTLVHTPPERHRPLLASITTWLRPGGLLLVNAPLGPEHGVEERWLGVPMFFGGIGEAATLSAVQEVGLRIESAQLASEDQDRAGGARFLWVTAAKPGRQDDGTTRCSPA